MADNTPGDESFQVTLPSNACAALFPSNQPNSYKIKLMRPIRCVPPSDWEFALIDIQFPHNWPNVLESTQLAFFVELRDRSIQNKKPAEKIPKLNVSRAPVRQGATAGGASISAAQSKEDLFEGSMREAMYVDKFYDHDWTYAASMELPKGHFNSIVQLGEYIRDRFALLVAPLKEQCGVDAAIEFYYDQVTGRAHFLPKGPVKIHFGATSVYLLNTIFRFTANHDTTVEYPAYGELINPRLQSYSLPLTSSYEAELEHLSAMYVYSNIAQYQLIGDTAAQLLAIVPIQSYENENRSRGQQQFFTLNPAYYMPVPKAEIEEILIQLNTDWGLMFPFGETGNTKVRCRLHFRKRTSDSRQPRMIL